MCDIYIPVLLNAAENQDVIECEKQPIFSPQQIASVVRPGRFRGGFVTNKADEPTVQALLRHRGQLLFPKHTTQLTQQLTRFFARDAPQLRNMRHPQR